MKHSSNFVGASSSIIDLDVAAVPQPEHAGPPDGADFITAVEVADIEQLIVLLKDPESRTEAISQLNDVYENFKKGKKGPELGLLLFYSKGTTNSLLEEIRSAYSLLSPPRLTMSVSIRISRAILLFQCMASHPEGRMGLITARIPVNFHPFLDTSERDQPFDSLKISCLDVIAALQKEGLTRYLLGTETISLCLRCMDVGGNMTKSLAASVLYHILKQRPEMAWWGLSSESFFAMLQTLATTVEDFNGKPPTQLLRNVLCCYLTLFKSSSYCDTIARYSPKRLRDPAYINLTCDDERTRALADEVFKNIKKTQVFLAVPRKKQFAGNRI